MEFHFDFRTSHYQFYLCDAASPQNTDSENFWTKQANDDRLALENGILGIGIQSYGHVEGELHLLVKASETTDFDLYNHIGEAGLEVKSGILQILDCPNSEVKLEIEISPGIYGVRVYTTSLLSAGIDEDEEPGYYKIEIWAGEIIERRVLKRCLK